jgi:hypothetical protein
VALAAACLFGLAGCNRVVSMEPWFTAADAEGVPKFREGLWLSVADADCEVDVEERAERWPDCASALVRRENEWLAMAWDDPDGDGPRRRTFAGWQGDRSLLVGGDPLILQVEWPPASPPPASEQEVEPAEADIELAETEEPDWRYFYLAMRPARFDEQGKVIAAESWSIECGPIPEPEARKEPRRRARSDELPEEAVPNVTGQPFPGLTIVGNNCTAESADAVRRAAVLSEPFKPHGTTRWVRDGWH